MELRLLAALGAISVLGGCLAPPLLMGAASIGALGGQMALTSRLTRNTESREFRRTYTASAIAPDIDPRAVRISNLNKRGTVETWTAEAAGRRYACSQEAGHTTVTCTLE